MASIALTFVAIDPIHVARAASADTSKSATSTATPAAAVPTDNPLYAADPSTQQHALAEAWVTFERSCRPCHGNVGSGDGPYARTFAREASDLRRPSREIVADDIRFKRIRDGAASLPNRPWDSGMPAFGDDLDTQQIWGLVLLLEGFGKEASGLDPDAAPVEIYAKRCAVCHGATGAGDGPLAAELMPPPRDFVRGKYRFRSTAPGSPPISNDVLTVLNRGMGNTSMGRMLGIGTDQMDTVAKFVDSFGSAHFLPDEQAILLGSPPLRTPIAELTARGRVVYDEQHCAECHGKDGRGDGPKSPTLKDEAGRPAIVTNLTKRWHLKGGAGIQPTYRILSTGLDGTPMPSYATTISEADRWAVGYFLERQGRLFPKFSPTVLAGTTTEKIPNDPTSPFWKTTLATAVPLGPQVEVSPYWTQPSVDMVEVTVAVNADQMGILLVWDDRTRDEHDDDASAVASTVAAAFVRYGSWRLPDQMAVQFIEKVDPKGTLPSHYLGGADRPVVRWIWSASRPEQALVERVAGARATPVAITDAPVQTAARYADGQWRVVLIGKRPPKTLAATSIALQSWDGSSGETGHWHSLSGWLDLKLR